LRVKLLILGGTVFLGRHIVETALQRGHKITLFTRGERNPDLFPDVEKLRGNHDGNLAPLEGRRWDAVIDTSGYVPRVVRASAELLKDAVAHYTFISSISVYAGFETPNMDETAPVGTLADEGVEEITGETYGPLKALCEHAVEEVMPGRALIIRPGLIVGPHDPTDRFTYWPRRIARGGEVLAPDRPDRATQFIDARDLADWTVRMAEAGATGTYNATGPAERLTMGQLLDVCNTAGGGSAAFTWASEAFLLDAGVGPWIELPLWVPESEGAGFDSVSIAKALAAGLSFRSLEETVRDTLAWDAARPADTQRRAGLDAEKERETLRRWHAVS
jgi:nucleoside-diphosphate-sugar epimerase